VHDKLLTYLLTSQVCAQPNEPVNIPGWVRLNAAFKFKCARKVHFNGLDTAISYNINLLVYSVSIFQDGNKIQMV